jgi:hypothetical protein
MFMAGVLSPCAAHCCPARCRPLQDAVRVGWTCRQAAALPEPRPASHCGGGTGRCWRQ